MLRPRMHPEEIDAAIAQVGDECRLDPAYRSIVRPLLRIPRERWPSCCGGNCEPCAVTPAAVADRALERLGRQEPFGDQG
jgi:hypothetical protein